MLVYGDAWEWGRNQFSSLREASQCISMGSNLKRLMTLALPLGVGIPLHFGLTSSIPNKPIRNLFLFFMYLTDNERHDFCKREIRGEIPCFSNFAASMTFVQGSFRNLHIFINIWLKPARSNFLLTCCKYSFTNSYFSTGMNRNWKLRREREKF